MRRLMQVIGDSSLKYLFLSSRLAGTGQNCGLVPRNQPVSKGFVWFWTGKGVVSASLLSCSLIRKVNILMCPVACTSYMKLFSTF